MSLKFVKLFAILLPKTKTFNSYFPISILSGLNNSNSPTFSFSGGYAVVHNQKSTVDATEVYDFREVSPSNTNIQDFEGSSAAEIAQPLTVGIPGFIRGMRLLHDKYGRYFAVQLKA